MLTSILEFMNKEHGNVIADWVIISASILALLVMAIGLLLGQA